MSTHTSQATPHSEAVKKLKQALREVSKEPGATIRYPVPADEPSGVHLSPPPEPSDSSASSSEAQLDLIPPPPVASPSSLPRGHGSHRASHLNKGAPRVPLMPVHQGDHPENLVLVCHGREEGIVDANAYYNFCTPSHADTSSIEVHDLKSHGSKGESEKNADDLNAESPSTSTSSSPDSLSPSSSPSAKSKFENMTPEEAMAARKIRKEAKAKWRRETRTDRLAKEKNRIRDEKDQWEAARKGPKEIEEGNEKEEELADKMNFAEAVKRLSLSGDEESEEEEEGEGEKNDVEAKESDKAKEVKTETASKEVSPKGTSEPKSGESKSDESKTKEPKSKFAAAEDPGATEAFTEKLTDEDGFILVQPRRLSGAGSEPSPALDLDLSAKMRSTDPLAGASPIDAVGWKTFGSPTHSTGRAGYTGSKFEGLPQDPLGDEEEASMGETGGGEGSEGEWEGAERQGKAEKVSGVLRNMESSPSPSSSASNSNAVEPPKNAPVSGSFQKMTTAPSPLKNLQNVNWTGIVQGAEEKVAAAASATAAAAAAAASAIASKVYSSPNTTSASQNETKEGEETAQKRETLNEDELSVDKKIHPGRQTPHSLV